MVFFTFWSYHLNKTLTSSAAIFHYSLLGFKTSLDVSHGMYLGRKLRLQCNLYSITCDMARGHGSKPSGPSAAHWNKIVALLSGAGLWSHSTPKVKGFDYHTSSACLTKYHNSFFYQKHLGTVVYTTALCPCGIKNDQEQIIGFDMLFLANCIVKKIDLLRKIFFFLHSSLSFGRRSQVLSNNMTQD